MTAVVSTNYDDRYLYFLPICVWAWNRIGVDVVCFIPYEDVMIGHPWEKIRHIQRTIDNNNLKVNIQAFTAPENKKATYSQVSRLFGATVDLPDEEVLVVGDIDMLMLRVDFLKKTEPDFFDIYGSDLVPKGQLPMCYAVANVGTWQKYFVKGRRLQECLDAELAHEEMENMRGNLWSRDQELLAKGVGDLFFAHPRTNGQSPFATNRYDRDDAFLLNRLSLDTIDFHMNRPGYEQNNFDIIMQVLKYHYPEDDFNWLVEYNEAYKKLL